jgi:hypothetical protein
LVTLGLADTFLAALERPTDAPKDIRSFLARSESAKPRRRAPAAVKPVN